MHFVSTHGNQSTSFYLIMPILENLYTLSFDSSYLINLFTGISTASDVSLKDFADISINCVDYVYESSNSLLHSGLTNYTVLSSVDSILSWYNMFGTSVSSKLPTLGHLNDLLIAILVSDSSVNSLITSSSPTLLALNNLELIFIDSGFKLLDDSMLILTRTLVKYNTVSSIDNVLSGFISYLVFITLVYSFLVVYFFNNNKLNTSEVSADNDYLSIWALSESEKELGSADDLLFLLIIVTYIFGWFFGSYFYFIVSSLPEFMTFVYSLPGVFYVVFSIPTYLMYDYGLYYGTYLRGASISSFFIYEFGYDIIMICVFYIRLALQAIRLVLMFIACASYYDYIMFYNYKGTMFIAPTSNLSDVSGVFNTAIYWFLIKIPGTLMYLAYEVLHLWFILISQTMSFFAMIFWLFLYLYTFFIALSVEKFFKDVRLRRLRNNIST